MAGVAAGLQNMELNPMLWFGALLGWSSRLRRISRAPFWFDVLGKIIVRSSVQTRRNKAPSPSKAKPPSQIGLSHKKLLDAVGRA